MSASEVVRGVVDESVELIANRTLVSAKGSPREGTQCGTVHLPVSR
jgi:hypothetical protein